MVWHSEGAAEQVPAWIHGPPHPTQAAARQQGDANTPGVASARPTARPGQHRQAQNRQVQSVSST